jgi:hypothetical protein
MKRSIAQIEQILSTFRKPDRTHYPELDGYSDDDCYQGFFGGGGLYLALHMLRTLRLKPNDLVLDLGCGQGATSVFWRSIMAYALWHWTCGHRANF